LEGGNYFGGARGLWQLIMSMRPKERVKKSEESGGTVRGFWLNRDREEQMALEELKGAEHEWSFWKGLEAEKD
jgi:hypothetical protein